MNIDIGLPTYELTLPSTGETIKVRPFIVKEEKLLLIASESKDIDEIVNTTKQIVSNCIIDKKINVDNLPFFDIDYLIIALRAKSVSESIEMKFTCNAVNESGSLCNFVFDADVDISKTVVNVPDIEKKITVGKHPKSAIVSMKYPSYSIMKMLREKDSDFENKIRIIAYCIDSITIKDSVITSKDKTPKEMQDFVEGLIQEDFKKLEYFVDNFPYFYVSVNKKCPKCGFDHHIQYTEYESFFQ